MFRLPRSLSRQPPVPCNDAAAAFDSSHVTPFDSLLAAAQEGAEWAWERLYGGLSPTLRGYLIAHGSLDPDDLLGEVWLQVARNIGTFRGDEAGFRSWVFVVAHHRIIDDRRRRGRRPETFIEDGARDDWAGILPAAEDDALVAAGTEEVVRLLAELTEEQRDVLTLRILGDLTVDQVAETLGKRPGAVKALQRRGVRTLKKRIEEGVPL